MLSEREKLDEELRFLKESFEIGVITEEEYENGMKRVEAKIKELDGEQENEVKIEKVEDDKTIKEDKDESQLKLRDEENFQGKETVEENKEEKTEEEPIEEQKKEIKPIIESKDEAIKREWPSEKEELIEKEGTKPIKEKINGEKPSKEISVKEKSESKDELESRERETVESEKTIEEKPIEQEKEIKPIKEKETKEETEIEENQKESLTEEQPATVSEENEKSNKKLFAYISIILILALGSWFFFTANIDVADDSTENILSFIACYSDEDCSMEDKIGICSNSGTADSVCKYIEDVQVSLKVLNDKDCFNCQTARIISILKGFYPNLVVENIELETDKGKRLAERFSLDALPAYIAGPSIVEAHNYDKLSNIFYELDGYFVMKKTVANSNYYFEREEIPKKLDLFLEQDQETRLKTDKNLKEFLEAFDGNILFERHDADSRIARELGINTFPTFLVNNKIKFSGVQPSDKIKENFCQLNQLKECDLELSKSLV